MSLAVWPNHLLGAVVIPVVYVGWFRSFLVPPLRVQDVHDLLDQFRIGQLQ